MKTYKVNVAGIEMILPENALEYIEARKWTYVEVDDTPTYTIEQFMEASLNEILNMNKHT